MSTFSSPQPFSPLLAGGALARETKGSRDTGFPVLDSRTSGLHVCSRDVSKDSVGQSWRFLLPLKISLFQIKQPIKKIQINSNTLCPQSPSFLVPRPQEAKRAIGTRMRCQRTQMFRPHLVILGLILGLKGLNVY